MRSKEVLFGTRRVVLATAVVGLLSSVGLSSSVAAQATNDVAALAKQEAVNTWHESIKHVAPPTDGCFHATYPSLIWEKEACAPAPAYRSNRHWENKNLSTKNRALNTVGNGKDFVAQTSSLIQSATGSFPVASGITSETDANSVTAQGSNKAGKDLYSLQMNTNTALAPSSVCSAFGFTECANWQQYIYATEVSSLTSNANPPPNLGPEAFIETFVWGPSSQFNGCPSGWSEAGAGPSIDNEPTSGCVRNAAAVAVASVTASQLANLKLEGTASAGGNDTVTFVDGTVAKSGSQTDVAGIASTWKQTEFNVVGDEGGTQAKFNKGVSITGKLEVVDGSTTAPTCLAPSSVSGSTAETNNLTAGKCTTAKGTSTTNPYIQFVESD